MLATPFPRKQHRRGRRAALISVVALVLSTLGMTAALAAPGEGVLSVDKKTSGQEIVTIAPGGQFTYNLTISCDDVGCVNASITDALPPELDGFEVLGWGADADSDIKDHISASQTGCDVDEEGKFSHVSADCSIHATISAPLGDGDVGLPSGLFVKLVLGLRAPMDLPADWQYNGQTISNTVVGTWDNGPLGMPGSDSASSDLIVAIKKVADVQAGKTWEPESQGFAEGTQSTITVSAQNKSNTAAETLVIQEPAIALDGATSLSADNPFRIVNFEQFDATALPEDATSVQVDAYIFDGTVWSWVPGPSGVSPVLPSQAQSDQVGGLRFTYSGGPIAQDSLASQSFTVSQRGTDRNDGSSLAAGSSITNLIEAQVDVNGLDPVSDQADAPFVVTPLNVAVGVTKQINPDEVPAGTPVTADLTVTNTSGNPVDELTLTDVEFFGAEMIFNGFAEGIIWPEGATEAGITWYVDGEPEDEVPFDSGTIPAPPSATITGFSLRFSGDIIDGATVPVKVSFTPALDLVTEGGPEVERTNTASATAENAVGSSSNTASDTITVFFPELDVSLEKTIQPTAPILPGGTVVAGLTTSTATGTEQVEPTKIVVEDVWAGSGAEHDFWNAFNVKSIAPTQVLPGTILTISYTTNGADWIVLDVADNSSGDGALSYSLSAGELANKVSPNTADQIVGLNFEFTNPSGFPSGTTVEPNIVYEARTELRTGGEVAPKCQLAGDPNDPPVADCEGVTYTNLAMAHSEGRLPGTDTPLISDTVDSDASASIQDFDWPSGPGPGLARTTKSWVESPTDLTDVETIEAQSARVVTTNNGWFVASNQTPGFTAVTLTDAHTPLAGDGAPTAPPSAADTVFQAFNLQSIDPISLTQDPLLRWDQVSGVFLYYDGAWNEVSEPAEGWMGDDGFSGYDLSAEQSQKTTGVYIVITENQDARQAASTDPNAPAVGSGVSSSGLWQYRPWFLTWELRNTVREDTNSKWVTEDTHFNDTSGGAEANGSVWNTVGIDASYEGGTAAWSAQDNIALTNMPPAVALTKAASEEELTIPESADVAPEDYPTVDFTLTAKNNSLARASYIRVTDPAVCAAGMGEQCVSPADEWNRDPFDGSEYDPETNPFEDLNVTALIFDVPEGEVSAEMSTVTLWERSTAGVLSTRNVSITDAQTMLAADLANVIGVSVLYQGLDPEEDGGSIAASSELKLTINTQVRQYQRSEPGTLVQPKTLKNTALAQSYDPVMFASGNGSTPFDEDSADLQLLSGSLDISVGKEFNPGELLESQLSTPVTVTLDAESAQSTVSPQQVTITDQDPAFWNAARLADDPVITADMPAGADQVRVDALVGGNWIEGTFGTDPVLPAVSGADLVGIRFVFSRSDQIAFSDTTDVSWQAQATFNVVLLNPTRTGTELEFPSTLPNQVSGLTERLDLKYEDDTADNTANLLLSAGTHSMDVVKTQPGENHFAFVGTTNPWTLEFTNTGTGILDIESLTDALPPELGWDYGDPSYTTSDGGTLSTNVSVEADQSGKNLTFTWPEDGGRMMPGETFTITLMLEFLPGLQADERTVNQFVVDTEQNLESCTNTSGNGEGILAALDANQCGTTNYLQPLPGGSLFSSKFVKGEIDGDLVDGQINPKDPAGACPTDAEGFTRFPCAAFSTVGATDQWKLNVANTGTTPYQNLTIVDPLPRPGDLMLATGASRESIYHTVFDGDRAPEIVAPDGTEVSIEITTASDPCLNSEGETAWPDDPTCSTTTGWGPLDAYGGAWEAVTALRFTFDFSTTVEGSLQPAEEVSVDYFTLNSPATSANPTLAPIDVPVDDPVAWNQMGVSALFTDGLSASVAPPQAGVILLGGDLKVKKTLSGTAADRAPDRFTFEVACTVAGASVNLPDQGVISVEKSADLEGVLSGLPLGSECVVRESGAVGTYQETSREGDGQKVVVRTVSGSSEPTAVSIENRYEVIPPPPVDPKPVPEGEISDSGFGGWPAALVAVGLIVAGAGALVWRRRSGSVFPGN